MHAEAKKMAVGFVVSRHVSETEEGGFRRVTLCDMMTAEGKLFSSVQLGSGESCSSTFCSSPGLISGVLGVWQCAGDIIYKTVHSRRPHGIYFIFPMLLEIGV